MTSVVIDEVTSEFPTYNLDTNVESDIHRAYNEHGGKVKDLPKLPKNVGGKVHFMIGIKYYRYFPCEVYRIPSTGLNNI